MRKLLTVLISFCLVGSVFARDAVYNRDKTKDAMGWHIYIEDDDVDATAELITELDTTYAQLSAEDQVEFVSSDAADITQTVTITGIDDNGDKVTEEVSLHATNSTLATTTDATFRYIDQVSLDAECAGTITVRKQDDWVFITSIPIGQLKGGATQHFNGEENSHLTYFAAEYITQAEDAWQEPVGQIVYEIRWYPDDADCLDTGDGYEIIDKKSVTATEPSLQVVYPQPITLEAGGWLAVYGTGDAANRAGRVVIQGYDER